MKGSHIDMVNVYMPDFFAKFGIGIDGFSSETKEPNNINWVHFEKNYCKNHPIWVILGVFLLKMVH